MILSSEFTDDMDHVFVKGGCYEDNICDLDIFNVNLKLRAGG